MLSCPCRGFDHALHRQHSILRMPSIHNRDEARSPLELYCIITLTLSYVARRDITSKLTNTWPHLYCVLRGLISTVFCTTSVQ